MARVDFEVLLITTMSEPYRLDKVHVGYGQGKVRNNIVLNSGGVADSRAYKG